MCEDGLWNEINEINEYEKKGKIQNILGLHKWEKMV